MKTVIAAVDFSTVTNRVADAAISLARLLKGKIDFVHVIAAPSAIRNLLPAVDDVASHARALGEESDRKMGELRRRIQRRFQTIEFVRLSGPAATTLVNYGKKHAASYIVLGSHGRSAAYDAVMGSVAAAVVKKAHCPVVVIPPVTTKADE
jgi:nucleotide-binding universal stress UspA family protein